MRLIEQLTMQQTLTSKNKERAQLANVAADWPLHSVKNNEAEEIAEGPAGCHREDQDRECTTGLLLAVLSGILLLSTSKH